MRNWLTALPRSALCLVLTLSLTLPRLAAAQDAADWQHYQDALQKHPQIVRYYRFEPSARAGQEVSSQVGAPEPLRAGSDSPMRMVALSDAPGGAVQLDDSWLETAPFEVSPQGFSIEIRFRKRGPGKLLGNGRTNGMVAAQGSGYWDGWRLWTSYPDGAFHFELGRAKPDHAFAIRCSDALPDGVWHHIAASWDGAEMRLYLNGVLVQAAAYAGDYVTPAAPFKIGYANQGIGSLKMDIQELAVFRGALAPREILAHACVEDRVSEQLVEPLTAATNAVVKQDWQAAAAGYSQLAHSPDASAAVRAAAQLAHARALRHMGQTPLAVRISTGLVGNEAVPSRLRAVALRSCLPANCDEIAEIQSARVYEQLLELSDLPLAERFLCHLGLAECLINANQPGEAREQYEAALAHKEITDLERCEIQLQMAHCLMHARSYEAARAAYSELASRDTARNELRTLAAIGFAHCFVREGDYRRAAATFDRITQETSAPAHLRKEAAERKEEMQRLAQGLPARDPAAERVKLPPRPPAAKSLFVAPDGVDSNPGTRERPLASLEGARDAIRLLRSGTELPEGGIEVVVGDGLYARRATFLLSEVDSGTERSPITYRAAPGATPRLIGGVVLEGFRPVADAQVLARVEPAVRDRVVSIDLRELGISDYGTLRQRGYGFSGAPTNPWIDLYVNSQPLQLARWPNDTWLQIGKVHRGAIDTDRSREPGEFEYDGNRPNAWQQDGDIWMFGAWGHLWEGTSVQVAGLDAERHLVSTRHRATYGFREGYPFYFFNVLEELDRPGEWYLDRATGMVYLIPPEGSTQVTAEFPVLSEPMVTMRGASHVMLEGLTFELGRTEGLVMDAGRDNLIAGCTFRRFGGNGLVIRGGKNHGLLGCDIQCVGAGGVRMAGGDYKTLARGDHFVENCHIHDFSRVDRVYAPAVHLDGVGNRIAHNLIHDSPHHAMRVEGFEHQIEYNEVHSVVYEYDDQAGIDIFGNPAYRGIVIRHNFWHHIGSGYDVAGQAGIRLDDFISSVLMYGNVFYRCAGGRFGGVQIHGGKDNIADNNLFVDCKSAFSFSPWGERRWRERLSDDRTHQSMRRGGMDVTTPPHSRRYPELATMQENADRNFLWRNVAVECDQFRLRDRGVNEAIDNHVFPNDPGFRDYQHRDFTLSEDSPVFARFPFRPIPFEEIGLYKDRYRATWPVQHQVTRRFVSD